MCFLEKRFLQTRFLEQCNASHHACDATGSDGDLKYYHQRFCKQASEESKLFRYRDTVLKSFVTDAKTANLHKKTINYLYFIIHWF